MKNEYFRLVKVRSNDKHDFEILSCIKKYDDRDIWLAICDKFIDIMKCDVEYYTDPYSSIYCRDLKKMLSVVAPDILDNFKPYLISNNIDLNQEDIAIYLASSNDYAKFDDKFASEIAFVEYINSETAEMDKHRNISEDILIDAGFEYLEIESNCGRDINSTDPELFSPTYAIFRKCICDKDSSNILKLDIDNGYNNRGTGWHLHIDNDACETIGSADIDTVWEFNTLMQVFKSKFRL